MLYTVDEVSKMLAVHPRTVRRYIEKGQLRGERIGGSWRISEEAVKALFNSPTSKDAITTNINVRSDNMLELFLQGKHRLQQNGTVVLLAFVFNPQAENAILMNVNKWMTELNRQGESAQFEFTLRTDENGLCHMLLIAPSVVAQAMMNEVPSPNCDV
ncbi:MAG: helix-turn-helix domain-containing protein [Defluviitaleaceae bacterium]|nr:helix-turn-helix domain-containing protein [Defluviitaleaceae bacterium]MCL2274872.1 helix-turn-helix domain-containing protein [Defluviitaleaceae bacterium]